MFKLIRNVRAYGPEDLGKVDILLSFERIAKISKRIDLPSALDIEEFDGTGLVAIPGLIDGHVHITGGGGEGGPQTRTPEISLSELTTNGITTVVGCLGTDAVSRSMAGLLAKARGLEREGISTYIYSGAYQVPTHTLLNSLRDDLTLIDKVVGAGEIAISDHRSSQPQFSDLAKLAAEARVGGMLGGKAGIVHVHLGEGVRGLGPILEILEETEIPITQFVPTHINRTEKLFDQGLGFLALGGNIDLTALGEYPLGGIGVPAALEEILNKGLDIARVTVSSDGNGSVPEFDEHETLIGICKASVKVLWQDIRQSVLHKGLELSQVLPVVTCNVARTLKLPSKGRLGVGFHADLVLLNQDLTINKVFAMGQLMVDQGVAVVLGTFEG